MNPQQVSHLKNIDGLQQARGLHIDAMLSFYKDFIVEKDLVGEFLEFLESNVPTDTAVEDYSFLSRNQIRTLRDLAKSTFNAENIYDNMDIVDLIEELEETIDLRTRVDFDPETGKPWE